MNITTRPMAVKLALILLLLDSAAIAIGGILNGPWDMPIYYYTFGIGLILDFVPLWFAFRRKNWARWLVAIYTLLCVCFDPFLGNRYYQTYSAFQIIWFSLSDILDIVALILLFFPSSNRWFRGQQLPPKSLQATTGAPASCD